MSPLAIPVRSGKFPAPACPSLLAGNCHGVEKRSQPAGLEFLALQRGVPVGEQADAEMFFQPCQGFHGVGKKALTFSTSPRKDIGQRAGILRVVEELDRALFAQWIG